MDDRVTPPPWNYSAEAEQSVIGALLLDNASLDDVVDVLTERDFYIENHRGIFRAILGLLDRRSVADVVTVYDALARMDADRYGTTLAYLGALATNCPSALNARRYAEIVRERSILRQLHAAGRSICESVADSGGRDAYQVMDQAQSRVMSLAESKADQRSNFLSVLELMRETTDYVDAQHAKWVAGITNEVTGVPTGFEDLDRMTTGMQPGQLIILAARPAMGKSAFALNVAEQGAKAFGKPALFFSMEMSARELGLRLLAGAAQVNVQRLVTGRVYEAEWPRVAMAHSALAEVPIHFSERVGLTVMELRAQARRALREFGGLSMVVIDYLQLMLGGDSEANRAAQLSEITRGLKLLARELNVPVIALSQLNRELEKRVNKRPMMADLRDSGSIEQDADVILFIYRDEVYNPQHARPGIAEVIVGKQRNGPTGTVELRFRADATRFSNLVAEADARNEERPF